MKKEFMDLVELVTGYNNIKVGENGIKYPTVFVWISGHVNKIDIDVHADGWDINKDVSRNWAFYTDKPLKYSDYKEIKNYLESLI